MIPRLEYTLGALGVFYAIVALVLPQGPVQAGLFLAAAIFSGGATLVWWMRRRRGRLSRA